MFTTILAIKKNILFYTHNDINNQEKNMENFYKEQHK